MFQIVDATQTSSNSKANGPYLHNIAKAEYISLIPSSAKEALYTLGRNVDDEFLILLPMSKAEDGSPVYHLEAYVCCSPAGFSLPQKLSLPLVSTLPVAQQHFERTVAENCGAISPIPIARH